MRLLPVAALLVACQGQTADSHTAAVNKRLDESPALVVPNDNRTVGGSIQKGARELHLEARLGAWRPDSAVDSTATVQTFAEVGGAPRIPGPLLRATTGTEVRLSVRNSLDSTLVVHGLRAGVPRHSGHDTIQIAPGTTRELQFQAGAPGTYLYWGTTTNSPIDDRPWRDAQLTGAIVIDPVGMQPDSAERLFVITVLDVYVDDTVRNRARDDIWEIAINGRSWPSSERLQYAVGDTVRWRWVNGSYLPHPMHLHGFHFNVLSKGDGSADTAFPESNQRLAVTELMPPGSTFRMKWVPTRAGNWLMHCHMTPHISPFPERSHTAIAHDVGDPAQHAFQGMAGLVLGITTTDRRAGTVPSVPSRHLRLFAQQASSDTAKLVPRGYVLQEDVEPRRDSVRVTSSPILLYRGETTSITVINRLRDATAVHWHGMELESVFDGVAGWSRTATRTAPLIAPNDSFTVVFTPPRAGTFIYHTHLDEGAQLSTGLYGAMLVLEPGEPFNPDTDLVFVIGETVNGRETVPALNGRMAPRPMTLRAGARYRLRFINILGAASARVRLLKDSVPVTWRAWAKDGADLPEVARVPQPAHVADVGVGETYDFEWTPTEPMHAVLEVFLGKTYVRQPLQVLRK